MLVRGKVFQFKKGVKGEFNKAEGHNLPVVLKEDVSSFDNENFREFREQNINCVITEPMNREDYIRFASAGLYIVEVEANSVKAGDEVSMDFDNGQLTNHSAGTVCGFRTEHQRMKDMVQFVQSCKGKAEYHDYVNCVATYQYNDPEAKVL